MQAFTDITGAEWRFPPFTLGLVLDVKDQTGVDFLGDDSRGATAREDVGQWFTKLYDPRHLGAVLWVIFETAIRERGLDERGFARRFAGETMEAARKGIVASLVSFIHSPAVATALKAELPAIVDRMEAALTARLKSTVGGLLASLDSTPGPSASGS